MQKQSACIKYKSNLFKPCKWICAFGQEKTIFKYSSLGTLDKEDIFCVLREVNYDRKESDLPKTLTAKYISIQTFYSARTQKLFKKTASTFIRLLILELKLLN